MQSSKTKKQNKDDEEDANKAALALYYQEFHKDKNKLAAPKAFVKGGTFDITKKSIDESSRGSLYIPAGAKIDTAELEDKMNNENKYENAKSYMEELRKMN